MGLLIAISQENHSNSLKRIKYKYATLTLLQEYVMSPISKEDVSTADCTTNVSFCLAVSAGAEVA